MTPRRYDDYRVVQSNHSSHGWSDEAFYPTDSHYRFRTRTEQTDYRHDVDEYRSYGQYTQGTIRIVRRREPRARAD